MHSHSTMYSTAIKAYKYSICSRRPRRIARRAVKTYFIFLFSSKLFQRIVFLHSIYASRFTHYERNRVLKLKLIQNSMKL